MMQLAATTSSPAETRTAGPIDNQILRWINAMGIGFSLIYHHLASEHVIDQVPWPILADCMGSVNLQVSAEKRRRALRHEHDHAPFD
jgi:hypothetical protein